MSNPDAFYMQAYSEEVNSILIPPLMEPWLEAVRAVLNTHGCFLEECENHCVVIFPKGTQKAEILPRVGSARYTIVLPDGTDFMEIEQSRGMSQLGFNKSDLANPTKR